MTLVQDGQSAYESVPCNLCGSTEYRVIYPAAERPSGDHVTVFRSSTDEALKDQLVACKTCGLQFVTPRLRSDLIIAGYSEGSDETFVSQAEAREWTFDKALDLIERHAPVRGHLLDIGTAAGSFLHVAEKRGWKVSGCEPSRWLCEWGKKNYGLDIRPGTHFEQHYPDQAFDVVTVWDVLEHVDDPKKFLVECQRILKPGGLLVVNYPDIGSLAAKAMGRKWLMLLTAHLYYFTRTTLAAMLRATGFDVVEQRPHIQWLELGYVLKRGEPVAGALARAARRVVSSVGAARTHVPYWLGQTLAIARKRSLPVLVYLMTL